MSGAQPRRSDGWLAEGIRRALILFGFLTARGAAQIPPAFGTTKGDLLVFDGAAWVRIAAGGDGEALQALASADAGLTWAATAAGDGYATVAPSGADYTSVGAALAAGKSKIRVTASFTEAAYWDVSVPSERELVIEALPGVVVTMGATYNLSGTLASDKVLTLRTVGLSDGLGDKARPKLSTAYTTKQFFPSSLHGKLTVNLDGWAVTMAGTAPNFVKEEGYGARLTVRRGYIFSAPTAGGASLGQFIQVDSNALSTGTHIKIIDTIMFQSSTNTPIIYVHPTQSGTSQYNRIQFSRCLTYFSGVLAAGYSLSLYYARLKDCIFQSANNSSRMLLGSCINVGMTIPAGSNSFTLITIAGGETTAFDINRNVTIDSEALLSTGRLNGALTINSGAKSRVIGVKTLTSVTNNDPTGSEVIGCTDSSGNAIPDQRVGVPGRFDVAALARLNDCIVKAYPLGDPVSSLEANPAAQGLGRPMFPVSTPIFGSTPIIGSKTSVAMGSGDYLISNGPGIGPNASEDFSLRVLFKTSSAAPTNAIGFIGWDSGASTGRLKIIYQTSSDSIALFEVNTLLATFALPTSWAADLGDGAIHDIIGTRSGSTWALYLDGTSVGTSSATPAADSSNVPFTLNRASDNPADISFAQAMHTNRALTAAEVTALWNSGTPLEINS